MSNSSELLTTKKVIGLLLGIVGVGMVVGWSPLPFSVALAFSVVASLAAAAFYGLGGVYTRVYIRGASSVALATCSQISASLSVFSLTFVVPLQHIPTLSIVLAVVALGLLGTAVGYLIYFQLIENVGPTQALTVTFLAPIFGVLWGVLLLGESVTLSTIIGFGIILAGAGLVTGVRFQRHKIVLTEDSSPYDKDMIFNKLSLQTPPHGRNELGPYTRAMNCRIKKSNIICSDEKMRIVPGFPYKKLSLLTMLK
ncbi:MAG TPA: DMT family transporter [Ktedonobacteraceae bacterium]